MLSASATTTAESRVRVAGVYATRWRYRDASEHKDKPPTDPTEAALAAFEGTRFEEFAVAFRNQLNRLPKPIARREVTDAFVIESPGVTTRSAEVYLFALPSDQVVASLILDCVCDSPVTLDHTSLDAMLDRFTEDNFTVQGEGIDHFLRGMAPEQVENVTPLSKAKPRKENWLLRLLARLRLRRRKPLVGGKTPLLLDLPERHEVVYVADRSRPLDPRAVQQLLYRTKAPHQKEYSRQENVEALTDPDAHKLGIVTTRASLVQGHDHLVETSALLSAVQAVGTLARFRDIWDRAYKLVSDFRNEKLDTTTGTQQRDDLENLVDELGNLEFDLTFSVEFPLMRIETYHTALSNALDVPDQATRLSAMFAQIGGSVRSELAAINIREARRHDLNTRRNALANQWFAFIGVPVAALLAFFGVNALEVQSGRSVFDFEHYRWAYVAAGALAFLPGLSLMFAKWIARFSQGQHQKKARRLSGH